MYNDYKEQLVSIFKLYHYRAIKKQNKDHWLDKTKKTFAWFILLTIVGLPLIHFKNGYIYYNTYLTLCAMLMFGVRDYALKEDERYEKEIYNEVVENLENRDKQKKLIYTLHSMINIFIGIKSYEMIVDDIMLKKWPDVIHNLLDLDAKIQQSIEKMDEENYANIRRQNYINELFEEKKERPKLKIVGRE